MDKRREDLTEIINVSLPEEEQDTMYHAINTKECHLPEISDDEEGGNRREIKMSLLWESERLKILKVLT